MTVDEVRALLQLVTTDDCVEAGMNGSDSDG